MDFLLTLLPATPLEWVSHSVFGLLGSLICMSFLEHFFHGYVMHQRIFPDFIYARVPLMHAFLYDHVALHHETYFKQFNYEPDPRGHEVNIHIDIWHVILALLVLSPLLVLSAVLISIVPPLIFVGVIFSHRLTWNTIHHEMHEPKYPFWSKWEIYRFLARYHYLHHNLHKKKQHVNYNIVLPFADYILGRVAVPNEESKEEMRRLGYLD